MFSYTLLTLRRVDQSQKPLFGFIQWQPWMLVGGRGQPSQLFGITLKSTFVDQNTCESPKTQQRGCLQVQMGGNSPSHFPLEQDEGGGLTFLKGIRVSPSQGERFKPALP